MSVTMKDIAKRLNVSVVTVSKAFKKESDISKKTRKLVLKTAKELNYTPNFIPRILITKKTNTLGVLVSDIKNLFFAEIISGIEAIARKYKYSILLCNTGYDPIIENKSIRMLLEKRVDGLLICPTQKNNKYIETLERAEIPYIFLSRYSELLKCNYIINDNFHGAYLAMNHLMEKGYKELYFLYKHGQSSTFKGRLKGCEQAISKSNIHIDKFTAIQCEQDIDSFYRIAKKEIIYRGTKIGVFVWNDHMALGAYKAMIDKRYKIPEEIGIVGYDDDKFSKYLHIPLTTVQNPGYEMGKKGTEIIMKRIKSKAQSEVVEEVVLKPKLIIRKTT